MEVEQANNFQQSILFQELYLLKQFNPFQMAFLGLASKNNKLRWEHLNLSPVAWLLPSAIGLTKYHLVLEGLQGEPIRVASSGIAR